MEKVKNSLAKISEYKYTTISGLNEGEKSFLPYFFSCKVVYIVNNKELLEKFKLQLEAVNKKVLVLESKLPLIYSLRENKQQLFKEYFKVVSKLALNDFDVLLLTPDSLFQKFPDKDFVLSNSLCLEVSKSYNLSNIIEKLVCMGYKKQEVVTQEDEFSVRGDILDIFTINSTNPIRISFFDDEIEQINYFDISSYKQLDSINQVNIFCNTFFDVSKVDIVKIKNDINKDLAKLTLNTEAMMRIASIVSTQFEYLENEISNVSSVFFLPYCSYFNSSIFDYLNNLDSVILIDEPKLITDSLKRIEEDNASSFLELSVNGELLPKTMEFYLEKKDILSKILGYKTVALARLISQNKIFSSEYSYNYICNANKKYINHFIELVKDCKNYIKNGYTIFLSAATALTLNKLKQFFVDEKIEFCEVENIENIFENKINISMQNIPYSVNFEMERFVLIGSFDLNLSQNLNTKLTEIIEKPKFLPVIGDYVVHQVHGVGKCIGIKNMKISASNRDYIIIEYKDGDILYLPCENADMLSAFVGEVTPKCNKIGGAEFFKVKQKVKNSLKEMAFNLISLYSSRLNAKGFRYSKDSYLQQEFENSFPYSYTIDQQNAISDIKQDMESGKIMDRLVCGDVGFGKTEVALVSAFKTIQDGKQVAFISPTTILSEQHFNTALSRLKDFMVNVEVINRFKTKSEQDEILKKLREGKVDLICGTHRLFSKDVKFKDLGLIILDEEQRFGVEDKDRLKNIKKNVNVLSLSATPIPRTLYMSLVGIRDVSYLSTAPVNRIKTNTMVVDYSDTILVDACKKEINRGGQVLIIYNKVESITNFYAHVCSLLPGINISFAHGQMSSKALEKEIYDLYSRKTQILISTVLIENGVDLPYANTLFVIDSDKLGLSQLYQLRGRIGRSNIEAYSYFSFSKNKILTEDSYKRLDAIMEFSDFGSGSKIALRDLEIRGAGDILGKLQHGHMQQVGYDMYVKLLNEAVNEIKGNNIEEYQETKVDISLNAYLPESYISSNEGRISFYTKVSKINSNDDLRMLIEQTNNIYGNIPKPVIQLCKVGFIKNLAQKLYIKQVKLDELSCRLIFYENIKEKELFKYLSTPNTNFVLSHEKLPIITLKKQNSIDAMQENLINFLINCIKLKDK